jgi:hypothetical protein
MKRILILTGVTVLVAMAVFGAGAVLLRSTGDVSIHAYIALGLGLAVTAALGGGLMALAFHSSRQGIDDEDKLP